MWCDLWCSFFRCGGKSFCYKMSLKWCSCDMIVQRFFTLNAAHSIQVVIHIQNWPNKLTPRQHWIDRNSYWTTVWKLLYFTHLMNKNICNCYISEFTNNNCKKNKIGGGSQWPPISWSTERMFAYKQHLSGRNIKEILSSITRYAHRPLY